MTLNSRSKTIQWEARLTCSSRNNDATNGELVGGGGGDGGGGIEGPREVLGNIIQ